MYLQKKLTDQSSWTAFCTAIGESDHAMVCQQEGVEEEHARAKLAL